MATRSRQDSEPPYGAGPDDSYEGDLASVVRIGREEDVAGICGRIDTSPTYAVVVHAPNGNRSLSTELGIRRLKRHTEESGKLVAIATSSVQLASRARQAGIPTARRPDQVRWDAGGYRVLRLPGMSVRIPAVGRYVQYLLLAAVFASIVIAALMIGPSATIEAVPATETLERLVTITAEEDAEGIDATNLVVPSSKVSARSTFTLAVKTTGKVNAPVRSSRVAITITNPSPAEVTIPAGTVLVTTNQAVTFATDADITIATKASATANASAQQKGVVTNVAAGAVNGFRDERFKSLTVTNAAVASGGANEDRPAVDPADIVAIRALAKEVEKSQNVRDALVAARPRDAVFLQTAETSVELGDLSPTAGSEATILTLEVAVTTTAQAILEQHLEELARAILLEEQGTGTFIPGTVSAIETGASQVNAEKGTVQSQLRLRGEFARGITEDVIRNAVKGKSEGGAKSTLQTRYDIQETNVKVTPGWAPRLPRAGFRIKVSLQNRQAEDTRGQQPPANAATGTASPAAPAPTARP